MSKIKVALEPSVLTHFTKYLDNMKLQNWDHRGHQGRQHIFTSNLTYISQFSATKAKWWLTSIWWFHVFLEKRRMPYFVTWRDCMCTSRKCNTKSLTNFFICWICVYHITRRSGVCFAKFRQERNLRFVQYIYTYLLSIHI